MVSQPSNAGIVTDNSGQSQIPESTRADGSTRKAIKVRPGYRPPEDAKVYKSRTAETFRKHLKQVGVPGAERVGENNSESTVPATAASSKNAKRREARKKAKASAEDPVTPASGTGREDAPEEPAVDSQPGQDLNRGQKPDQDQDQDQDQKSGHGDVGDRDKKARNLKKKIRQAEELEKKRDGGEVLLPEQISKITKLAELTRELESLGLDG